MSSTLSTQAPDGARFEFEEVKTDRGQKSLGEVPILVWENLESATSYYGEEGITNVLDGTSLRVSFQGIARRLKVAGKSDDEIAAAMIAFRPGKRAGGQSTPVSRAARAAKSASEKVNGDAIAQLLEKIAKGEITPETLQALGIEGDLEVPEEETDEAEGEGTVEEVVGQG